jgi:hypothetical protein
MHLEVYWGDTPALFVEVRRVTWFRPAHDDERGSLSLAGRQDRTELTLTH